MKYNPDAHHRRSIRLPDYDYCQNGAYFVTVCAYQRECLFGSVSDDGVMRLNEYGVVVQEEWLRTETIRQEVELGVFVVMPNHFHGIVILHGNPVGANRRFAPTKAHSFGTKPGSLGAIIQQFKSIVTKRINALRNTPGAPVWQRNYYEHIIRDARDFSTISEYVLNNPARWAFDRENPANVNPTGEPLAGVKVK